MNENNSFHDLGKSGNASMHFDEQEMQHIAEIAIILDTWHSRLGRQFGPLSRPQRRMLLLLRGERTVRVGDLAEQLGLTTAGTTRMLDHLEELGYAARARAANSDQRQVYVTLTAKGAQALLEADAVFLQRVQASLCGLNETESSILLQLLRKLHENTSTLDGIPRVNS
jgi:DNA-binding MarR family transcriptional regulator